MPTRPKKPAPEAQTISFAWRPHDGSLRRVWLSHWFGDQFEIMTPGDFHVLEAICARFGIPLLEAEDD